MIESMLRQASKREESKLQFPFDRDMKSYKVRINDEDFEDVVIPETYKGLPVD